MRSIASVAAILSTLVVAGFVAATPTAAQESCSGAGCSASLVTPVRIGRPDAQLKLTLCAQQDYSHLAANREVARSFLEIFEQWARLHPDVQIDVSVMPAL